MSSETLYEKGRSSHTDRHTYAQTDAHTHRQTDILRVTAVQEHTTNMLYHFDNISLEHTYQLQDSAVAQEHPRTPCAGQNRRDTHHVRCNDTETHPYCAVQQCRSTHTLSSTIPQLHTCTMHHAQHTAVIQLLTSTPYNRRCTATHAEAIKLRSAPCILEANSGNCLKNFLFFGGSIGTVSAGAEHRD